MTAGQLQHPVADVLRVLAVSRSSGALEVRGRHTGTFFLHEGDITYAEAAGLSPAEQGEPADQRFRSTLRSFIVETGLVLLADENVTGERPLFRPGRRHWSGLAIRLAVDSLLSEIAGRLTDFTKGEMEPEDEVQLCGLAPARTVVLSRQQWALAAVLSGPQTARALASRSGLPLSATIETLAELMAAGVLERGASPKAQLPHRVRGATAPPPARPLPSPASDTAPRMSLPEPDDQHEGVRALALQLLAGLRRL